MSSYEDYRANELEKLFTELKQAALPKKQEQVQEKIWKLWLQSGSPEIDSIVQEGIHALQEKDFAQAIRLFSQAIRNLPDYAEGWNKRATAYYMRGEFKASLEDIRETLRREPHHFGAISGLASIYNIIQDYPHLLKTLKRLQAINPHQKGLQEQIDHVLEKLSED